MVSTRSYHCPECRTSHCKWAKIHDSWVCFNCEYHKKFVDAREACNKHRSTADIEKTHRDQQQWESLRVGPRALANP
eukprot:4121167-Amphidinium_carterae.1